MRRIASWCSLKIVIFCASCLLSMPYHVLITYRIPGRQHFAWLCCSYEPLMRDFATTFHFARYSGVSFGASGPRPCEPSAVGDERVGGGNGSLGLRVGAGAAPASLAG